MRFTYQTYSPTRPSDLILQQRIVERWRDSDHAHPQAFMDAVRAWGDELKLGLTVNHHNGAINIHGPNGLLVRVRSNA